MFLCKLVTYVEENSFMLRVYHQPYLDVLTLTCSKVPPANGDDSIQSLQTIVLIFWMNIVPWHLR
jgi:hypothetical protein